MEAWAGEDFFRVGIQTLCEDRLSLSVSFEIRGPVWWVPETHRDTTTLLSEFYRIDKKN